MAGAEGEFELIDRLLKPLATHEASLGLTDDAAVLTPNPGHQLVLTKDMLVEGVHFLKTDDPADIAVKALRVNLSDLAAMGARPIAYLMALSLNPGKRSEWLEAFVKGLAEDQERYNVSLIGGDLTSTPGPMTVSITALGEVPRGTAVRRCGAQPGDAVFVTGTIGDAALGLALLQERMKGRDSADGFLVERYLRPEPRTAFAATLREVSTAAIDISDGLAADLAHIATESGVRAVIEADLVPLSARTRELLADDPNLLIPILTGGDDYELLLTVPPDKMGEAIQKAGNIHIPLTLIGHIQEGEGVAVLDVQKREILLERPGFRHF